VKIKYRGQTEKIPMELFWIFYRDSDDHSIEKLILLNLKRKEEKACLLANSASLW